MFDNIDEKKSKKNLVKIARKNIANKIIEISTLPKMKKTNLKTKKNILNLTVCIDFCINFCLKNCELT